MKGFTTCCIAVASCFAISAFACENPAMVSVPDGTKATMDELLSAQAEVKSYMAAMDVYLACIDAELETQGEEALAEFRSLMTNRHNAAVNEMETVAVAFNEQVQAYRAANPESE